MKTRILKIHVSILQIKNSFLILRINKSYHRTDFINKCNLCIVQNVVLHTFSSQIYFIKFYNFMFSYNNTSKLSEITITIFYSFFCINFGEEYFVYYNCLHFFRTYEEKKLKI